MQWRLLLLLILAFLTGRAQDKVYLTNGSLLDGKVLEVGLENLILQQGESTQVVPKLQVVLVHYRNGITETYNAPERDVVVTRPGDSRPPTVSPDNTQNMVSFNMLGLVNADLMFFYERLLPGKKVGIGALAGYNFNPHVNATFNTYMAPLTNAKKQGDLGLFINFYRKPLGEKRNTFFGFSVKYTPIKFTSVIENSVTTGTLVTKNIILTPSEGKQVATLFHLGKHFQITQQFFLRGMAGIGLFKLTGEYRTQFNYMQNKNTNLPPVEITVLPKIFLSFHAGYCF